jgi:protein TonB
MHPSPRHCLALSGLLLAGHAAEAQQAAAKPSILNIQSCAPRVEDYPSDALRDNLQGTVRLRFTVAASGELKEVALVRSSGAASLDQAAAKRLSRCKFAAAKSADGSSIESSLELEYVWRIH